MNSVIVAGLIGALFISCCNALPVSRVGPFELPDDNASPPPNYDFDGRNITIREGDIIDRGGGVLGEAAAVGVPWKDARIPYVVDCSLKNVHQAISALDDAIKAWHERTCIRFVPKEPSDEHFVTFLRAAGCWASDVGYRGRSSTVSIGEGCGYKHVMVHELGHVIGFWHEQSRPDRDNYVRVLSPNIIPSLLYNFNKVTSKTESHGEDYDYGSIMHYPLNAFAVNREHRTLEPLRQLGGQIPYVKLSDSDVKQANKMYKCNVPDLLKKKKDKCIDEHPMCSLWADHNHCNINPEPLLMFCKKSCDNCGPCKNENSRCPKSYSYRICAGNANFALRECKAVCEICEPDQTPRPEDPTDPPTVPPTDPPTVPLTLPPTFTATTKRPVVTSSEIIPPDEEYFGVVCVDRSENCEDWKNDGRCETDSWVNDNCLVQCERHDVCDVKPFTPGGTCANPLGLSRWYKDVQALRDASFQSSSYFLPGGGWSAVASAGRLYNMDNHRERIVGAWCGDPSRDKDYWFQVKFEKLKRITGVVTQGRDVYFEHVKTYEVEYLDEANGKWKMYSVDGETEVFKGNCDHFTPVLNIFENPITTKLIRIRPKTYRGAPCLRTEFFGCDA